MDFLYLLEKCRVPVLNEAMLLITRLGEETAFLALALVIFWCVDKRRGYFLLGVGFIGNMVNHTLKLLFRVPRPWVLDENFTILEQARKAATGYSFPSGHSQTAVGTFGAIAATSKNVTVRWLCIAAAVLVPFSRMYIGVHTPADVLVGSGISLILIFLLRPALQDDKKEESLVRLILLTSALFALFISLWPFPADMDAQNLASGVKNAYTMAGCAVGLMVVYSLEKKYVNFDTKASWKAQILKTVLGFALVLAVKEGLRSPLEMVFSTYIARSVRYFLVVVTAGLLWPMTFRYFAKIGEKT